MTFWRCRPQIRRAIAASESVARANGFAGLPSGHCSRRLHSPPLRLPRYARLAPDPQDFTANHQYRLTISAGTDSAELRNHPRAPAPSDLDRPWALIGRG